MNVMRRPVIRRPPKMIRRANRKQETRKRLLDSAYDLFSREGFENVSIRRLTDGCGMTTGAVFASFDCKGDILVTLLEERFGDDYFANLIELASSGESALDKIALFRRADYERRRESLFLSRAWIHVHYQNPPADVESRTGNGISAAAHRKMVEYTKKVSALFRQYFQEAQGDPQYDALALWHRHFGLYLLVLKPGANESEQMLIEQDLTRL